MAKTTKPGAAGASGQAERQTERAESMSFLAADADRLLPVVDSITGTITRSYDGLDRLIAESTPLGSVSYGYDAAGRRTSMTVSGQPSLSYSYDNANHLKQITQGSATVALNYDGDGRRTSTTLPNGVAMNYSYDAASELTGITYTQGSNTLGTLSYAYDAAGRRMGVGGSYARTGVPQAASAATYNVNNQLTNWKGATLTYDANGNLTSDGTNTYTWNARNQLVSISGGVNASFQYDAFGRRVSKTIGGTTQFLYDGANPVQEISGSSASANLLTGGVDEYFQRTDSAGARSFLTDALGSTLALADSTGTVQTSCTFEPFGNATLTGATTTNSFAYTGREIDATGLYFYRARYYNPSLQRFISEDPLRFRAGEQNLYSYSGNDPINRTDHSGLFAPPLHQAISFAAGILSGLYDLEGAVQFGTDVALVDAYPGTQRPDAYDANTHAMSGRKPNGNRQSCQEALQGAEQQLVDDIRGGHIPMAVHTIEDNYAAGHRGFQYWPGGSLTLHTNVATGTQIGRTFTWPSKQLSGFSRT